MDAVTGQVIVQAEMGTTCSSFLTRRVLELTLGQRYALQHVVTGHAYDKKSDADKQGNEPAARLCVHCLMQRPLTQRNPAAGHVFRLLANSYR